MIGDHCWSLSMIHVVGAVALGCSFFVVRLFVVFVLFDHGGKKRRQQKQAIKKVKHSQNQSDM